MANQYEVPGLKPYMGMLWIVPGDTGDSNEPLKGVAEDQFDSVTGPAVENFIT